MEFCSQIYSLNLAIWDGRNLKFTISCVRKARKWAYSGAGKQEHATKTQRDISIFMAFLKKKSAERKVEEIMPEQLGDFLSEFIITVKSKDGGEFEPSSLRGFLSSFNRHLKVCKYPKSKMEDLEF